MDISHVIIGLSIIIAGIISIELGISVAILEVIAGIIIGNTIGPIDVPWIEFLANFGLLGVMFFAGFETDPRLMKKHFGKSLKIGMLSFALPFALVFSASYFLLGHGIQQALLFAIGLSTTSIALVYFVLKDGKVMSREQAQTMITGAMFIDILTMLSLSLLFEGFTLRSGIILALVIASFFVLPKMGKWLFSRYKGNTVELKVKIVLMLILATAVVSEAAGVHAALLAFVVGLILSELIEEHEAVENKLRGIIFAFMAPLFFFSAGLAVDISKIDAGVVLTIVVLGIAAYIGKYFGTYATVLGYCKNKGLAKKAGFLFNFRLSLGVIVATVGLSSGVIGLEAYIALITIVIFIDIMSSVMLKILPHEQ